MLYSLLSIYREASWDKIYQGQINHINQSLCYALINHINQILCYSCTSWESTIQDTVSEHSSVLLTQTGINLLNTKKNLSLFVHLSYQVTASDKLAVPDTLVESIEYKWKDLIFNYYRTRPFQKSS